jgi:uncharacterized membrane protein
MRKFTISTHVSAPVERVWQIMSDVERWHEWTASITSVKRLDGGAFAVGSRAMVRQPKFPPALWKVTEIEPGNGFTWESVAPGLRAIGRHTVEQTVTGSRVTLSVEFEGLFGGVWGRMTRDITERYLGFEAAGLKIRSEQSGSRRAGASEARQRTG